MQKEAPRTWGFRNVNLEKDTGGSEGQVGSLSSMFRLLALSRHRLADVDAGRSFGVIYFTSYAKRGHRAKTENRDLAPKAAHGSCRGRSGAAPGESSPDALFWDRGKGMTVKDTVKDG